MLCSMDKFKHLFVGICDLYDRACFLDFLLAAEKLADTFPSSTNKCHNFLLQLSLKECLPSLRKDVFSI